MTNPYFLQASKLLFFGVFAEAKCVIISTYCSPGCLNHIVLFGVKSATFLLNSKLESLGLSLWSRALLWSHIFGLIFDFGCTFGHLLYTSVFLLIHRYVKKLHCYRRLTFKMTSYCST